MGEPVSRLITSGDAQKKNSYTPSAAQSSASSFMTAVGARYEGSGTGMLDLKT
jgi:hypothetical protein